MSEHHGEWQAGAWADHGAPADPLDPGSSTWQDDGWTAPLDDWVLQPAPVFDPGPLHLDPPTVDDPVPDPGWGLGAEQLHHFDPGTDPTMVVGDPWADLQHWHQQTHPDTCAIVSQEFILDELTGRDVTEAELIQVAEAHGWYAPGQGGTAPEDVGNLLELYGIPVERQQGATIDDLATALAEGRHVIVGLDADEIWAPGIDPINDDLMEPFPGMDANHAVEVIGIDFADPEGPMVILNDPGHPEGRGSEIPLAEFEGAWADSMDYMVTTRG